MPAIRKPIAGAHCPGDYEIVEGRERFFIGVDIAQTRDRTALAFLHVKQEPLPTWGRDWRQQLGPVTRHIRRVERLKQGISYVDVARYLDDLSRHPGLLGDLLFVLDASGVGRGFLNICQEMDLPCTAVTMTSGEGYNRGDDRIWRVGKTYLLGSTAAAIETRQLQIVADAPGTDDLVREMEDFSVEFSKAGKMTANAKSGSHDDTIIATALAYFGSEMEGGGSAPSRLIGWR